MPEPSAAVAPEKPARAEFHIPSLDGLRAVSFLIVFVSHAGLQGVPGGFGVTVFFFLSGYLITTLMRMEHSASGAVSFRDFYLRRILRILPPFYVVLALAAIASLLGVLPHGMKPGPMLALVLHYANFWEIAHGTDGQPPGTGVYWSLAVEEHFYLIFPVVFVVLQRTLKNRGAAQAFVLLGLCALVMLWRTYLVLGLHVESARTFLGTDTRVDSILFGCALAVGANPMLDPPVVSRNVLLRALLPGGLALLLLTFVARGEVFRETVRYSLQGIALAPLFMAAMLEPKWGPFPLLNRPLVRRLGALSYSLYLVHQVILHALMHQMNSDATLFIGILALALSIALAEIIQRFVEKPCAKLRRKFAHAQWLSDYKPPARERSGSAATA